MQLLYEVIIPIIDSKKVILFLWCHKIIMILNQVEIWYQPTSPVLLLHINRDPLSRQFTSKVLFGLHLN